MGDVRIEHYPGEGEIFADPMISKVIISILENALCHGGEDISTITISVTIKKDALQFMIADDNIGIVQEETKRSL